MSLLLDALKEAENRHRRGAPTPESAVPESAEVPEHVLALADDIAPLTQPTAAARAAPENTATVSALATLRAARRPDAPLAASDVEPEDAPTTPTP